MSQVNLSLWTVFAHAAVIGTWWKGKRTNARYNAVHFSGMTKCGEKLLGNLGYLDSNKEMEPNMQKMYLGS